MKSIKKLVVATLITALAVSVTGCGMIEKTPEAKLKQVVAKVGNEKITRGDVEAKLKPYENQFKQTYGENYTSNSTAVEQLKSYKTQILDSMIQEKLLVQYVKEKNLKIDEDQIKKTVEETYASAKKSAANDDEAKFKEVLANEGLTEESFKESLRNQQISSIATADIGNSVAISDDDVKKYLADNPNYLTENKDKKFIQYILVKDKAIADDVKKQLDAGADFSKLAAQYSQDPSSKDEGGYLGTVDSSSQLIKPFVDAALTLQPGQVSNVVEDTTESKYGFFLIKAITPEEGIKFNLAKDKKSTVTQETLDKLKKEKVTKYEDNLNN